MENETKSQTEEKTQNNEPIDAIIQNESQKINLFCYDCFQIPEYTIKIDKKLCLSLFHECINQKKKNLPFQKEIEYSIISESNCHYCHKKCYNLCIECKNFVCQNCEDAHIPKAIDEIPQLKIFKDNKTNIEERKYFFKNNDIQFICKVHFLQYKFFCPICRKNLCIQCRNYHNHINSYSLFDYKIKNGKNPITYSGSNEVIINLNKLSEVFTECYQNHLKKGKMSINIIMNFSLINSINDFIESFLKKKYQKKEELISNSIFSNEKEESYLCEKFGDDKFKKKYSVLIDNINNGDYESYYKMEVLKEFYNIRNRMDLNYNLNLSFFNISLKGIIEYFQRQYQYINNGVSAINSNINNNYLKKEIDNLKLILKIYETDIKLLRKINIDLRFKYNFQLRRKTGNLLTEIIINDYWHLLKPISETDYILFESILLIKKKLSQINNLEGPREKIEDYKQKLMNSYSYLLNKSNANIIKEINNSKDKNPDLKVINENEAQFQFCLLKNGLNYSNEAIILSIFFKLRKYFSLIFNEEIHNKIEKVNTQVKSKIEKLSNFKLSNNNEADEQQNKKEKEKENNKIGDNKCVSFFKGMNEIKNILKIDDNTLINKYQNILKVFEPLQISNYTESNLKQFKLELEKLFKNYEFQDSEEIQNVLNLYFKGEILDVKMEKHSFQNTKIIKDEIDFQDLENAKNETLKGLNKVETLVDELLKELKIIMINTHSYIRQFEGLFDNEINNTETIMHNPSLFLDEFKTVILNQYREPETIKQIYMIYLINFFFYAQDVYRYLKELKRYYKEIELINALENNFEKKKLIDIYSSTIKYEETNDLKNAWNDLKKEEEEFVKDNPILNRKIKEYIKNNDEKQFLFALTNLISSKSKTINLSKSDSQNLIIKAYWLQNGIPLEIPKELTLKN